MRTIIICRDRLECTKSLVEWCLRAQLQDVILVDNASTYEPFIEWAKNECPYPVHHSRINYGHAAPWELSLDDRKRPYCVTDCDIVPVDACPLNVQDLLAEHLEEYRYQPKVGLGLVINDLPMTPYGDEVRAHEMQFWRKPLTSQLFSAPVDTTFAVYRPRTDPHIAPKVAGLRTNWPCQARHTTWYLDRDNLPVDEQYYLDHIETRTHWTQWLTNKGDNKKS